MKSKSVWLKFELLCSRTLSSLPSPNRKNITTFVYSKTDPEHCFVNLRRLELLSCGQYDLCVF